jgi:nicotinamide-nucleotide amidase
MNVEIINTGTELLLGRVLNTHQQWLCRRLADAGYVVSRQVSVSDTGLDIQAAVREALTRADLVITTGGLGPTSDDITRDLIASLLHKDLKENSDVLAQISRFFAIRNRRMPTRIRLQAMVPEGAVVLPNPNGTAPGLAIEVAPNPFRHGSGRSLIIMLPGPPRELHPMFTDTVLPLLRKSLPAETFVCRTLRSTGIGESVVEEMVSVPLDPLVQKGIEIGYCARPGQVDVRLTARGAGAESLVSEAATMVGQLLGVNCYAKDEEELEFTIVRLLRNSGQTVAVAESCTGGIIAHRLTNVPGASAVFNAGIVTYSNQAKIGFLGVPQEILQANGAVSEVVAGLMAEGIRARTDSTYGLGITGIAGPSGGTPEMPVGTVFIGLATGSRTVVVKQYNPLDRESFKQLTCQQAMEMLRRAVLKAG